MSAGTWGAVTAETEWQDEQAAMGSALVSAPRPSWQKRQLAEWVAGSGVAVAVVLYHGKQAVAWYRCGGMGELCVARTWVEAEILMGGGR